MRIRSQNQLLEAQKAICEIESEADCNTLPPSPLREGKESFTQEREFIDAKKAAVWLGIPLRSFHQYVQKGLLPSYKLGRHRLFRKKELLSALSISRIASRDEVLL